MLMNKPVKMRPIGANPEPPTQEQLEAQAKRAFLQKRNSLAEGILFNAIQSGNGVLVGVVGKPNFKPAVDAAVEAADYFMEKLYSVAITEQKPEEAK